MSTDNLDLDALPDRLRRIAESERMGLCAPDISAEALDEAADVIDRLNRWKYEALPVIAGLQELGKVLGLPLGASITGTEAAERARELARERDAVVEAAQGVHVRSEHQRWVGWPRADRQEHYCMADQGAWPCETMRALDAAIRDGGAE